MHEVTARSLMTRRPSDGPTRCPAGVGIFRPYATDDEVPNRSFTSGGYSASSHNPRRHASPKRAAIALLHGGFTPIVERLFRIAVRLPDTLY